MEKTQSEFTGWAVVEIFGHQRCAGYVTTEAFGTAVLFRVDVPPLPERERLSKHYEYVDDRSVPPGSTVKEAAVPGYTKYYGPSAIYAMTPCSQEAAEKVLAGMQPRAVSIVKLADERAIEGAIEGAIDADENDEDDDVDDEVSAL